MINNAYSETSALYYSQSRSDICGQISLGPNRVLDLGCGAGAVGRTLYELKKASEVTGVEIYPPAAAEALKSYAEVHQGDLESLELNYSGYFDYVLCGDILEHLKDPIAQICRIHRWLKPGGRVVCSLPNVRYWQVIFNLVFLGRWTYEDAGIMDRTHLRFYTRRSAEQLFIRQGFQIEHCALSNIGAKRRILNRLTFGVFVEFLGKQVLLVARKKRD